MTSLAPVSFSNTSTLNKPSDFQEKSEDKKPMLETPSQDTKKSNSSFKYTALGSLAGLSTYIGFKRIISSFYKPFIIKKVKELENIPKNNVSEIAETMQRENNLIGKGAKFRRFGEKDVKSVTDEIISSVKESGVFKFYKKFGLSKPIEYLNKRLLTPIVEATAKGENAFYFMKDNKIYTGEKTSATILHEIGHMINANKSKFAKKGMIIARALPLVVLTYILLNPLLKAYNNGSRKFNDKLHNIYKTNHDKNTPGTPEYELSKKGLEGYEKGMKIGNKLLDYYDKFYDWIDNNAGKLILGSFIPTLIDEATASLHAHRYASKVLDKAHLSKLRISLGAAFGSYLLAAGVMATGVKFGLYVKDNISKSNKNKTTETTLPQENMTDIT